MKTWLTDVSILFWVVCSFVPMSLQAQTTVADETLPNRIGVGSHASLVNTLSGLIGISLRSFSAPDVLRYKNVTSVEYLDGNSWVSWQTEDWKQIMDASHAGSWVIDETQAHFRFTIDLGSTWIRPSAFLVGQDYSGGELDYALKIESSPDQVNWNERLPYTSAAGSRALSIFRLNNQTEIDRHIRLTFDSGAIGSNRFLLYQLSAFTKRRTGLSENSTLPYVVTWDKKIGFGTTNPSHKVTVAGAVKAEEIIVTEDTGADFVFDDEYRLMSLEELEAFVTSQRHLPGIPTASHMIEHGVSVGELQIKLLQKIEELTLYIIHQEKVIRDYEHRFRELESHLNLKEREDS